MLIFWYVVQRNTDCHSEDASTYVFRKSGFTISNGLYHELKICRRHATLSEKQLERLGVFLSRQTLANWMMYGASHWLSHLYEHLHTQLLRHSVLFADETTLQVLSEPGRPATSKPYMWLYRTGRDVPAIVLYDYQQTRAAKHPKAFLSSFEGFLHVDGYQGYNDIPKVKLVGCWADARRKFSAHRVACGSKE